MKVEEAVRKVTLLAEDLRQGKIDLDTFEARLRGIFGTIIAAVRSGDPLS